MAAFLATGLAAGCSSPSATGDSAGRRGGDSTPEVRGIAALGRLLPKGGILDVAGPPGTRVGQLQVGVGQVVQAGEVLFVLDSYPILAANAEAAEARLRDARNLNALETRQGAQLQQELALETERSERIDPLDLQILQAQVEARQKAAEKAHADLTRLTTLRQKGSGAVSEQELESSRFLVHSAEAEVKVVLAQRQKAEQAQALSQKKLSHDRDKLAIATDRAHLAAQVDSAQAASEAARLQRDAARIVAPRGGRVLRIMTHEGESIGNQPVLQLGDTDHMMVVAEVSELDILRLRSAAAAGPVLALIEALGGQLHLRGQVLPAGIGRIVGKNRLFSLNPTIQADDRVVEVDVEVVPGSASAPPPDAVQGLSNLQVEVLFPLEASAGSSGPGRPVAAKSAGDSRAERPAAEAQDHP